MEANKRNVVSDPIPNVEEPTIEYNVVEKFYGNIEDHPLFAKVVEKAIKEVEEGKGSTTEEVMKRVREKYPFLK